MAPTPRTISSQEAVLENPDLLTRILIGFPAKPLIQLKVVAKSWRGLISNPEFASRHTLLHHPTNPSSFFVRSSRNNLFQFISLSEPTATDPLRFLRSRRLSRLMIIQSCNGLVLLSSVFKLREESVEQSMIQNPTFRVVNHVYNPTTNKLTTLPFDNVPEFVMAAVAFDPRRSPHYKVIGVSKAVVVDKFLSQPQLHVYTSESGEWRVLGVVPKFKIVYRQSAYCNGAVYWISHDKSGFRFDIDQEILTTIPRQDRAPMRRKHLYETNGHLQLAQTTDDKFIVWELQSDYSGWYVKYQIGMVPAELRPVFTFLHMAQEDDEKKGSSMWFHVRNKVNSYNFRDHRLRVICDLGGGSKQRSLQFGWNVHPFNESLAPA